MRQLHGLQPRKQVANLSIDVGVDQGSRNPVVVQCAMRFSQRRDRADRRPAEGFDLLNDIKGKERIGFDHQNGSIG